jgi:predicted nuclease with TOPRIM domain
MLEEKLMAAEQQCNELSKNCHELNSVVNLMRDRLKRLEAENSVLRTSVHLSHGQKNLD